MRKKIWMSVPAVIFASSSRVWAAGSTSDNGDMNTLLIFGALIVVIAIGMWLFTRRAVDNKTGEMRGLVKLLENQLEDASKRVEEGYLAKLEAQQIGSVGRQIDELMNELVVQLGMMDQIKGHHYRVGSDLKDMMENDKLDAEKFQKVLELMESSKAVMRNNLKATKKCLEDFRDISNAAFYDERQSINLKEYIDKSFSIMQYELRKKNCQIELDIADQTAMIYPGAFSMAVIQMMLASTAFGSDGSVRISSGTDKERFFMVYHDNRMLISDEAFKGMIKATDNLEEDLDPAVFHFQMMYYLVKNKLGGKIKLESLPERGTDLCIIFPIDSMSDQSIIK